MEWEFIEKGWHRHRVPGGWLVRASTPEGVSITYVPDPKFEWDPVPTKEDGKWTHSFS